MKMDLPNPDNTLPDDLISIIIPTIGRSDALNALLNSIAQSHYKNFEIIIVDQNLTSIAEDVTGKYKGILPLQHVKAHFTGAARARNYGFQFSRGKYVIFPDDDSELFPETLGQFLACMRHAGADVVFGRAMDRDSKDSVAVFSREGGYLSLKKYEDMFIEFTMFIKKEVFAKHLFDESFGIGTFYGAEEAHDLILRMLHDKVLIFYSPDIGMYHPKKIMDYSDIYEKRRVFSYRMGYAHLCVKHRLYRKYFSRVLQVMLFVPYTVIFAPRKTRYYLSELMGLLTGMIVR